MQDFVHIHRQWHWAWCCWLLWLCITFQPLRWHCTLSDSRLIHNDLALICVFVFKCLNAFNILLDPINMKWQSHWPQLTALRLRKKKTHTQRKCGAHIFIAYHFAHIIRITTFEVRITLIVSFYIVQRSFVFNCCCLFFDTAR